MKILILNPERNVTHRISKDISVWYETRNNFGDKLVHRSVKKTLDLPPLFFNIKNA